MISRFKDLPPEWRAKLLNQAREDEAGFRCIHPRLSRGRHRTPLQRTSDAQRVRSHCVAASDGQGRKAPPVSPDIQDAFLSIWIENKMLPRRVGHRPTMAAALRVLMPRNYSGPPLVLYRGTQNNERRRHLYGFSWTTEIATAQSFAEHWSQPGIAFQGVVLRTLAPPEAVLLRPGVRETITTRARSSLIPSNRQDRHTKKWEEVK